MTHRRGFLFGAALAAGAFGAAQAQTQTPAPVPAKVYVCPPCGCSAHGMEFSASGNCPACGMALIEKTAADEKLKVAVLIFPGVQIIDFAAPYEVFGQAGYAPFTVARTTAPVAVNMGLTVTPALDFANCPKPDILVIPGGAISSALGSPETLAFIRAKAAEAKITMTVCNGALIGAKAGLLDGLKATTFFKAIDALEAEYPKVMVVSDARFVDNGRVVTTAGLSAGIDGALHAVERLSGKGAAQTVALNMEYDWKAGGTYARAAFADYPLLRLMGANSGFHPPEGYRLSLESTSGDKRVWNAVFKVETAASLGEITTAIEDAVAHGGAFPPATRLSTARRSWRYRDKYARVWRVDLNASEAAGVKRVRMTSTLLA